MITLEPIKIKQSKRYDTYQFHAFIANEKSSPQKSMNLCILEVMSWIRRRFSNYENLPDEFMLPEPCKYDELDSSLIRSFHYESGCIADAVYIKDEGIWSFYLHENDMGVNPGTPFERPPLNGRTFETYISFRIINSSVEVGVKTVCTEPNDNNTDCEVFRPLVIKNIAENAELGFCHIVRLSSKALRVNTNSEFDDMLAFIKNPERSIPAVIITMPVKPNEKPQPDIADIIKNPDKLILSHEIPFNKLQGKKDLDFVVKSDDKNTRPPHKTLYIGVSEKKKEKPRQVVTSTMKNQIEYLPTVDVDSLAGSLITFGVVYVLQDSFFSQLKERLKQPELNSGDIALIYDLQLTEIISYKNIKKDIESTEKMLKENIRLYPKRRLISYGNILFNSEARIYEINRGHSQNLTKSEQIECLENELRELRQKIKNYEDADRDHSYIVNENKRLNKKNTESENEIERLRKANQELSGMVEEKDIIIKSSSDKSSYYISKLQAYSGFPTRADEFSQWVEKNFYDTIIIHKNAVTALIKKDRTASVMRIICDGVFYLSKYAEYRAGKIPETVLGYYAHPYNWSASSCGKITLRDCDSEYRIKYFDIKNNKTSRKLEMHIKNGTHTKYLVRIYFFWDAEREKIVIGYLPDHLQTATEFS